MQVFLVVVQMVSLNSFFVLLNGLIDEIVDDVLIPFLFKFVVLKNSIKFQEMPEVLIKIKILNLQSSKYNELLGVGLLGSIFCVYACNLQGSQCNVLLGVGLLGSITSVYASRSLSRRWVHCNGYAQLQSIVRIGFRITPDP